MSGQVYLCFDGSGLWKIGITNNHKKRLNQLRTGNATIRMILHGNVKNPSEVEYDLHSRFQEKRISGEWFDLSPSDLYYIFNKFLGENNKFGYGDMVVLHDVVNNQKKANDINRLQTLDKRFAEIENE